MIGYINVRLAHIMKMIIEVIHLYGLVWDISIDILPIYRKSCSLPQGEIPEGPEHATKADSEQFAYDDLPDKILMVINVVCRALLNPLGLKSAHILILIGSDQWSIKGSINRLNPQDDYNKPKRNINYHESTAWLPKRSNSYGNGGLILGYSPRTQAVTKVAQSSRSFMASARNGAANEMKLEQENSKFVNLYRLICNKDLLITAYKNIRSNQGGMTPGADKKTLDGVSDKYFDALVKELISESFKFTSVKRIYIPKSNGKTRPLGIPTSRDKIVQEAIRILLETIYEGKFSDMSHGFRPKRSCHTALHQVSKWNGITWMVEGDIKGFFDNVDHQILVHTLEKTIKDQRFIDLLWKLFRAGYIEGGLKYNSYSGVPQGGVVSPILSNIYLHEFDKFMDDLIEKLSSKEKLISKVNPKIVKYSYKLTELDVEYQNSRDKNILKRIKELRLERNQLPSRIRTGNRVWYVRYADDWLIGVIGNKEFVENIKEQCREFLAQELKIELSEEKTKITNVAEKNVNFLGFDIRKMVAQEVKIVQRVVKGRTIKSRINSVRLNFCIPVKKIIKKLEAEGFVKKHITKAGMVIYVPNAITKWIFLDHRSIILRYNAVIRGLINYYGFADNLRAFHSIINLYIHHSCAKTLARKLNLSNRAKAFRKFGRFLAAKEEGKLKPMKLFTLPSYAKNTKLLTQHTTVHADPFAVMNWKIETQTGFFKPCWVCGDENDTEMHHVKHIRKSGTNMTGFTNLMSKLNRKQIPVCRPCHRKIHNGEYNGISLKELHIKRIKENETNL
jgi:group II intron reverse transcriptase/maturase